MRAEVMPGGLRETGPDGNGTTIALSRAQPAMKLFAISNRGLAVIGMLVMMLWGVILAEKAVVSQAHRDHYEFLESRPHLEPDLRPRPTALPRRVEPVIPVENLSQTVVPVGDRV